MAAWQDDPARKMRVQWYFADPDAPMMPFATVFGSRTWEIPEPPIPTLGEVESPRPWRGGLPPYPVGVGGLCGSKKQWQEGLKTSDPVPPTWPGSLVPRCCVQPPSGTMGGIAWGGYVSLTRPSGGIAWGGYVSEGVATGCCPGTLAPRNLLVTFTSATGGCACWDGFTFTMSYNDSSHVWEASTGDPCGFGLTMLWGFGCTSSPPPAHFTLSGTGGGEVFITTGGTSGSCSPVFSFTCLMQALFPSNLCHGDGLGVVTATIVAA